MKKDDFTPGMPGMQSSNEKALSINSKESTKKKEDSNESTKGLNFMWRCLKSVRIEVVTFVYMFSYVMRSISSMSMIMDKVCRIKLSIAEEVCNNLTAYETEKQQVETIANNYHLYHTLIEMAPSALFACFLGPWSDRYGRKLPICVAFGGIIVDGVGTILCAYFVDSQVEYYMIPPIMTALSGGFIGVFTVVYSYITDIATPETRTFKFALMEMGLGLGIPLGTLAGGMIFQSYGLVPVFGTSVAAHVFGLVWVVLLVEETRGLDNLDSWRTKVRNFFSIDRLIESVKACTKQRPHKGRLQIWLLLFSMSFAILSMAGTSIIAYLFAYHHYSWSNPKYSTVSAVFTVFGLVVMLVTIPILMKCFGLGDPTLGILGSVSSMAKNIGVSLAYREGIYYFANLIGIFSGLSTLAGRSRISKIVSQSETGKVFAFLSTVESIVPIIATTFISQLFNATKNVFPDPSYLIIGLLSAFPVVVFVWTAFLPDVNYQEMEENGTTATADKTETLTKVEESKS